MCAPGSKPTTTRAWQHVRTGACLCAGMAASTAAWLAGSQLRVWNCLFFTLADLKGVWFLGAAGRWVVLPLGRLAPLLPRLGKQAARLLPLSLQARPESFDMHGAVM